MRRLCCCPEGCLHEEEDGSTTISAHYDTFLRAMREEDGNSSSSSDAEVIANCSQGGPSALGPLVPTQPISWDVCTTLGHLGGVCGRAGGVLTVAGEHVHVFFVFSIWHFGSSRV